MISTVSKSERHADEVSYTAPLMLKGATVTQLARNLLCVLRTLTPESNFMFRRHFIGYYKRLQIPFIGLEIPIDISKVTYFEWLIAVTKFLGAYFAIVNGFREFKNGLSSYFILCGWNNEVEKRMTNRKQSFTSVGLHTGERVGGYDELNHNSAPEQKLIHDGVNASKNKALRAILGGAFELACGVCFLFLGAGELHYFDDDLNPIIDATIVMQVALAYFLYIMAVDIVSTYLTIDKMQKLISRYKDFVDNPIQLMDNLNLNGHFCSILGVNGAWEAGKSANLYNVESANIRTSIAGEEINQRIVSKKTYWDIVEKRVSLGKQIFVFILNLIAGHGFNLGVIAFKFPTDSSNFYATLYRHGLSVPTADFYGNFAGDFAWTMEPLFVIFADKLVAHMVTYRMELESFRATSGMTSKTEDGKKLKMA